MVAYQFGKAAKIAPPAVSSHTSLASQNGPMELIRTRRSVSFLASTCVAMPTPKSKPSKKKNPMNNTATSTNHNSLRDSILILLAKRIMSMGIRLFFRIRALFDSTDEQIDQHCGKSRIDKAERNQREQHLS
ncbi:hypothetical protein D3C85_1445440 [compost metagenome]